MTNRLPWSKGYFETVDNSPLGPAEVLSKHSFLDPVTGNYFDEMGNEVFEPKEPIGDFVLWSFRTIDEEIAELMGF